MTTQETIKALQTPFPPNEVKWKVQATKGAWSTYVAYVDSRAVAKKLDEATSLMWQDKYEEVSGLLICSIGLFIDGHWIWRSDTGTESDMDKEKGHVSDAFKRCAVKWGVGRDLYEMPIIKIKNTGSNNGKPYATYKGKPIYDATSVCRELIQVSNGNKQIWWDDEKPKTHTPPAPPKVSRKDGAVLIAKKITIAIDEQAKNEIAYELTDSKHVAKREEIISKVNAGANPADVLSYLYSK
mgnify:CR=1 FL=1